MSEKKQEKKFKEAARDLECDEREEEFEQALKRIASAPPKDENEKD